MRDFREVVRGLLRTPAYALTVVIVVAPGIGANIVSFNFYSAVALAPVPGVADSAALHTIGATTRNDRLERLSWDDFRYLRDHLRSYQGFAGTALTGFTVGRGAEAIRIYGERVTGDYFPMLGIRAQHGRLLSPADDVTPRAHPVVVISDQLWRRHFGADPSVVGRTIVVDTVPLTIVGVAEPSFHGTVVGLEMEAFVPMMMQPALSGGWDALSQPGAPLLYALARPRAGVTLDDARREAAVNVHIRSQHQAATALRLLRDRVRAVDPNVAVVESRMLAEQTRLGFAIYDVAARVLGFIGAVAIALATVGIYGLVAYTIRVRVREIGIRMAIGEPRRAVIQRYLAIGARVGLFGAAVGVIISLLTVGLMSSLLFGVASTDATSLALATVVVLILTIAAAAIRAWRASRLDPLEVLRSN